MAKSVLSQDDDAEREDWLRLSMEGLNAAYGEDEEEYSVDSIIEANPDFEEIS